MTAPNSAPAARRSVGIMVIASMVSAMTGAIQMFWIPKILSVSAFGYWRAFILYTGYVGILHLGLTDGALLRWSTKANSAGRYALWRALTALTAGHLLLWGIWGTIWVWCGTPRTQYWLIGGCVLVYALLFNLLGLVQVHAQSRCHFRTVAMGMAGPGLLFVLLLLPISWAGPDLAHLVAGYLAASCLWAICLVAAELSSTGPEAASERTAAASKYIAIGWPIMLANAGFGLMQSVDRISVNLALPIRDFSVYSLSQSTIYVPIAVILAISRGAFSHLARVESARRDAVYRRIVRLLAMAWAVLIPYYFLVEQIVANFLPKYAAGLPSGLILLLSVLFLSLIQIVQMNAYSLLGLQKRFFLSAAAAVALAFLTAYGAASLLHSLVAVAWSQVFTAGCWWLYNEWDLRLRTGARGRDPLAIVAVFVAVCLSVGLSRHWAVSMAGRTILFYALAAPPLAFIFRAELAGAIKDRIPARTR